MQALSAKGVGRRSVGAACDVSDTVLSCIITGRKTNIRAATERAILAVTAAAAGDRVLIPAKATWKLLDELIADGYTKTYLAHRLGNKSHALQLKRNMVTVRNAYLVERMFEELKFECAKPTMKVLAKLRDEGYTQSQIEQRLNALAAFQGKGLPSITPNKLGRISTSTADLVERLHLDLTA